MARNQNQSMARTRQRRMDNLTLLLGAAFLIVAIITAVVAYKVVNDMVRSWTMTPLDGLAVPTLDPNVKLQGTPIPGMDKVMQAESGPAPVAWDGTSRLTILIIGLDARDLQANAEASRSDTMMLLTLDPISKTAGMLSIPRDMWVNIPPPVNKYAKINQAYYFGDLLKLPGGGPAMAVKTVQSFIGVPIQFYAQIDFQAFEKFIDTLGGINVTVTQEMDIDPLGRTADNKSNTMHLTPGRVHLTGPMALAFARARHDLDGGDFDRASNQQEVIMGIREKILRVNMLPTLVSKANQLYQDLASGIHTNLTLDQVVKLSMFAINIQPASIKKGVLGPNEIEFAKSAEGLDILIPKPDQIRIVRDQIFTTGGPASPASVNQDELALVKAENARVSLRNGSSTTGLANLSSDYFKKNGLNIVETSNADKVYTNTTITIYNGKPYTATYLAKVMNVPTAQIIEQYTPDAKTDIIVVLGQDWARKNPMGTK
jgi:LCP family protein required for cell wall assembly